VWRVVLLELVAKSRRCDDLCRDSPSGDLLPATETRMQLVEGGLKSLGQLYVRLKERSRISVVRKILQQTELQ
jgi:hypothetical protein